ncbi:MAG: glycoside hydrolase family 43 protein [Adhaeribacter sp.]
MKKMLPALLALFCCLSFLNGCRNPAPQSHSGGAGASYRNPVIDQNFPDPAVIRAEDGYYYAYATNHQVNGERIHIQVSRSRDLVKWEAIGEAMPEKPTWGTRDFWAPHVIYDKKTKTYYLYYSAEADGKCLGVATAKSPAGPFADKGTPLLCGEGFLNIDPMAFDDPQTGKKLLYWGSGFKPIKVQELADDRLHFKPGSVAQEIVRARMNGQPDNYENLVEGAWVVFRDGFYYLFYSGDNCCGDRAHYAVMVARARQATGPFETLEQVKGVKNSVILVRQGRWKAPGHNSLITDAAGQDWMLYHAIDTTDTKKGRVMLLDRVSYEGGWPVIRGGVPSSGDQPMPVTR